MKRGKFIVLEGGEGSGKTTVAERLINSVPGLVVAQDPGGTPLGQYIREYVLFDRSTGIDPRAELLLFLASRAELVQKVIKPALESGKHVLANRFTLSSIAYQVYGRQQPALLPFIQSATKMITDGCDPDLTILLDVTPQVGIERTHTRPGQATRFDMENMEFHARVREGFKKHIADYGKSRVINADKSLEEVWTNALAAVQSLI